MRKIMVFWFLTLAVRVSQACLPCLRQFSTLQKTLIISGQISARLSASVSTSRGRLCLLRPILVLVSKIKTVYHKSGYWSCHLRPKVFSLGLDLSLPFRSAYTPFYHKASLPVPVTVIIPISSPSSVPVTVSIPVSSSSSVPVTVIISILSSSSVQLTLSNFL